jgi:nucleotide-binding universal stress UspA family protein
MFANILVPLDGSALSAHALPVAHHLAQASATTLHLLQVIALRLDLATLRDSGEATVAVLEMAQEAARRLRDAQTARGQPCQIGLAGLAGQLQPTGLQVITALREGAADEHIVAYAQEHAIDLIVMSTHGYSGFKRFFLGSVTDRVLRAGQTPVLVVPAS